MKNLIFIFLISIICTNALAQKPVKIRGDKEVVTTTSSIDNFSAIEINDDLEVTIRQGNKNSCTVNADKNLQDVIRFEVTGNVLKVFTSQRITYSKKLDIDLEFVNLNKITIRNGSEVKSKGDLECETLEIFSYDNSEFDLNTKAHSVTVNMFNKSEGDLKLKSKKTLLNINDGAKLDANVISDETTVNIEKYGELEISGDSDKATFKLKDWARLEGKKMKVSKAVLMTSNKTDVEIYASKKLEINA